MKQYRLECTKDLENRLAEMNMKVVKYDHDHAEQLRHCQAWNILTLIDIGDGTTIWIKVLQSYFTAVAFDLEGYVERVWNGKSPTTSRQITWWRRDYVR